MIWILIYSEIITRKQKQCSAFGYNDDQRCTVWEIVNNEKRERMGGGGGKHQSHTDCRNDAGFLLGRSNPSL